MNRDRHRMGSTLQGSTLGWRSTRRWGSILRRVERAVRGPLLMVVLGLVWVPTVSAESAEADASPVEVTLEPWAAHDGVDRPFRYIVTMRPRGDAPLEVVADRRLLSFVVRRPESRRRFRCAHPHAPPRPDEERVRTSSRGGEAGSVWREWIDLRMYCWGGALAALRDGAQVEGRYGWRRADRRRWVARTPESPWREWTGGVDLVPFSFSRVEEPPTRRLDEEWESDTSENARRVAPVHVMLSSRTVLRGGMVSFRPSVRAREGRARVYVRPDSWSFEVRGPTTTVRCAIPPGGGAPPADLFRPITERYAAVDLLDAEFMCPEGTFDQAGVYEVVPELSLRHSGEEWGYDAIIGRFAGPPSPIRVTAGGLGYVEQSPRRTDEVDAPPRPQ